jgi:hypothetical protein
VVAPQPRPYTLELIAADGRPLPTYQHRGRYYIPGEAGERYVVRVTNPTPRRIEAVVSVDGLDVIDGETADFVTKRGYIVPAYGEVRIEGFRTSAEDVAAFRFSAVADSYAGRKGKARHVGVVGLAIFEERELAAIAERPSPPIYDDRRLDDEAHGSAQGERSSRPSAAPGAKAEDGAAPAAAEPSADRAECCGGSVSRSAPAPQRPGLGTEFGERRYSAVSFTQFERRNARLPDALAELRYNDVHGLAALGVPIRPTVTGDELDLRETASPFPDSRFASPPPGSPGYR